MTRYEANSNNAPALSTQLNCSAIVYSIDGKKLAVVGKDTKGNNHILTLNPDSLNIETRFAVPSKAEVVLAPDLSVALVGPTANYALQTFALDTGTKLRGISLRSNMPITDLAHPVMVSQKGDKALFSTNTRHGGFWQVVEMNNPSFSVVASQALEDEEQIEDAVLSNDGKVVFTGGSWGGLASWSIGKPKKLWSQNKLRFDNERFQVFHLALSPDNKYLASSHADGSVRVWDSQSGKLLKTISSDGSQMLKFSPNNEVLASISQMGQIILWNHLTTTAPRRFSPNGEEVVALTFAPDGKSLATISKQGLVSGRRL